MLSIYNFAKMKEKYIYNIASVAGVSERQVNSVKELIEEGATIPFMARYRKERTGNLDEVVLLQIKDKLQYFEILEQRKEYILNVIKEQDKLTTELEKNINDALELTVLEDLYLPYKPKRKTRATKAKELGLEPLANKLYMQVSGDAESLANEFLNDDVLSIEDALQGARDIIAEWISEDKDVRERIRKAFERDAILTSTVNALQKDEKYRDYFEYSELLKNAPSHRILAIFRDDVKFM